MENKGFRVRPATTADADVIVRFNADLAEETEHKRLDPAVLARGVLRGLQRPDDVRYFLAIDAAGEPVGQLMLTREWSDWRDGWIMWLQSVYVVPEWRGRGVFRGLLDSAVAGMREDPDVVGVRLYVEVDNERAQQVYLRNGFQDARYRVLERMFGEGG